MSHSRKSSNLDQQLDNTLTDHYNKPDFRELDLGSPVSPLITRSSQLTTTTTTTTTTTSTSSSSSGSFSCRSGSSANVPVKRSDHSGELSGSSDNSPIRNFKTGHSRSGSGTVNSPTPNVLPAGNICPSGRILKTGMAQTRSSRTDVLGSGSGNYGHGSIMRGSGKTSGSVEPSNVGTLRSNIGNRPTSGAAMVTGGGNMNVNGNVVDAEEVKRLGNEQYKRGNFGEALRLYDRAIGLVPGNAAYRSNRAAALAGLGRVAEATRECEEAVRLDPNYLRAHQRLASLLLRLGQIENSKKHLYISRQHHDPAPSDLEKLQTVEKHLYKCTNARKTGDWQTLLRESDAAVRAGADSSPQLFMCRVEALIKLNQLEDADGSMSNICKSELSANSNSQSRIFGMLYEAYLFFVRAQFDLAFGRFENAVTNAEKAGQIDPRNIEVAVLLKNVRLVARSHARGNDLFKSERFTEACSAYGEGLRLDPSNSILYCNRAACWFKLGLWERSIDDCNHALRIQPNYIKALLRRAASNSKLERWADAVRDYEVLRRELPDDNEVAESLFHAQVALKKSRGEEVYNMKFGGDVEEVSGLEQFRASIALPGVSVVHFHATSNSQCKQIAPFVDTLCNRYPSINFLKVDIEQRPAVASAENVRIVPTFKIYKNGSRVKEIICPSRDMLENSPFKPSIPNFNFVTVFVCVVPVKMVSSSSTPKVVEEDVAGPDSSVKNDVDGNDNVAGAVLEEEVDVHDEPVVLHDEPVAVHDEKVAVHNVDVNEIVSVTVAMANMAVAMTDLAVTDMGETDVEVALAVVMAKVEVAVVMADVAVTEMGESDVALTDVGENDVAVTDVPDNDVAVTDVPENDVAVTDVSENDVAVTDVPDNDGSDVDSDGSEDNWSDVAGSDGGTDRGSDVDDVSVDGISFCSDREDEELVSLMTQANNFTETAATHGPEKDAIRQNRRVTNASNSDNEYEVGADYMEDSNLNWSLTEDEDDVANNNGEGEVNSAQIEMDEEEIPHTEMDGRYKKVRTLTLYGLKLDNVHAGYGIYKINPMASENFWKSTNTQPLVPPPARKKLGRPKEKRIPEFGEGGTSTKASRKGRRMRCNLCKVIGHNKRTCPLKGYEEALVASVAAYYASISASASKYRSIGSPNCRGRTRYTFETMLYEAGPSVPSSKNPEQPKRKKVKLTIDLSKPVSTVPVVEVLTVPVVAVPTVPIQAITVPVRATTVPDVPVVAPFMRGPKLVKKRKAGDVRGQTSKKPWK
ncbi:hypothetical protein ACFE04_005054 [Oxalis oulophora]